MRLRLWRGTPRGATGDVAVARWRDGAERTRQARRDLAVSRVHLLLVERAAPMGAADIWLAGRDRWGGREFGSGDVAAALAWLEREDLVTWRRHDDGRVKYEVTS